MTRPPANPGAKDWALARRRHGVLVEMSVPRAANVSVRSVADLGGHHLSRFRQRMRAAMLDLIDGPGYADAQGRVLFSYAHPIFWAPFTLVGDGGGANSGS